MVNLTAIRAETIEREEYATGTVASLFDTGALERLRRRERQAEGMAVRDCPERSPGYPSTMSTLTEIETAVATLPRAEKELLHARLGVELKREIAAAATNPDGRLAALEALQKSFDLDDYKVRAWQALVRDACR